jgi:catechol 2,3-dioxygenase-like lactoylglutathione lyase family enzyme
MKSKPSTVIMHNVGIMCEDLEAMVAFFVELGLEVEGEIRVEGRWMERVINIDDAQCDIAMLRTPDGHNRLELSRFVRPKATSIGEENAPVNTLGIRRIMFRVDDLDDALARLRKHGATLVGEVAQYKDTYRLCYIRGPEGIMLALAEEIG